MEGPLKFLLGALEIQMVGAPDPQQKMSTESPVNLICNMFRDYTFEIAMYYYISQGLYSLSGKTSYRQILKSLEATRLDVIMIVLLWNLTSPCQISERLEKFKPKSHGFRGFARSCGKTSYRLVNKGPGNNELRVAEASQWVIMIVLLWNLTSISAAVLPRYLSNFRAIGKV